MNFFNVAAIAQGALTSDAFFEQNISTIVESTPEADNKYFFSWLDQLDFRTETRDFDFENQEYTLRLSPGSKRVRQANERLYNHYKLRPNSNALETYNNIILQLYLDWIDLYFINAEIDLNLRLKEILKDKEVVYNARLDIGDFEPESLFKLELEKVNLEEELFVLQNNKTIILAEDSSDNPDFSDLIRVENIEQQLELLNSVVSNDEEELAYESEKVEYEIALENAESKQYFDFAQLRYRGPHEDPYREKITLGLGFRFNNSIGRKYKIDRLRLEQYELELEKENLKVEQNSLMEALKAEVKSKIERYKYYLSQSEKLQLRIDDIILKTQAKVGFNPEVILEAKEAKVEVDLEKLQRLEDVYISYLRFLRRSGQLYKQPFKNYLKV